MNTRLISFNRARIRIGLIVAGMTTLALPAAASASPTDAQYSSSLDFISQGAGPDPGGTATSSPGDLPFTGLDVGLLAAVAAGLVIAGLMLRRARPKESLKG